MYYAIPLKPLVDATGNPDWYIAVFNYLTYEEGLEVVEALPEVVIVVDPFNDNGNVIREAISNLKRKVTSNDSGFGTKSSIPSWEHRFPNLQVIKVPEEQIGRWN